MGELLEFAKKGVWPVRHLGGLPIAITSRAEMAAFFIDYALRKRGHEDARAYYSTSANGQVMAMCADDDDLRDAFLKADDIVADGMPMVWYSWFFGKEKLPERVATTDLVHNVAELAVERGATFFMLGADEEANCGAVQKMSIAYPGLQFVGRRNGFFSEADEAELVAQINEAAPDVLWVSMGVPREQHFINRNIDKLTNVGVIKTSGGLFDFLSGKRSRAPGWMQDMGLEWLYRAMLEPKRLGPRYFATNPKALALLFTQSE